MLALTPGRPARRSVKRFEPSRSSRITSSARRFRRGRGHGRCHTRLRTCVSGHTLSLTVRSTTELYTNYSQSLVVLDAETREQRREAPWTIRACITLASIRRLGSAELAVLALLGTAFFIVILDSTIVFVAVPPIQVELELDGQRPVGAEHLPADLRWPPALRRPPGRPAGPSTHLHDRHRPVHRRFPPLRTGLVGGGPDRITCCPRRRRGHHGADRAVPAADHVRRRPGPQQGARDMGRHRWSRRNRGPPAGRPVTAALGWEWIFFINVPVGVALLVLSRVLLRESRDPSLPRTFDLAGAVTITLALVLLVYGITEAPSTGWSSPRTWVIFVASAALMADSSYREALGGTAGSAAHLPLATTHRRQCRAPGGRHDRRRHADHPDPVRPAGARYLGRPVRTDDGGHDGHVDRRLLRGPGVVTKRGFRPVAAAACRSSRSAVSC